MSDRRGPWLDSHVLCNYTEGGIGSGDVDPTWTLGCHGWMTNDGQQWMVTVDDDGIAWTWCRD